VQSSQTQIPVT